MSVIVDRPGKKWIRKHDQENEGIVGAARAYPEARWELEAIVADAELGNSDPQVRAAGSHWALSEAAMTHGVQIETHDPDGDPRHASGGLNKVLHDVIPGCISDAGREFLRAQEMPTFSDSAPLHTKVYFVHVEAGMRIWELYAHLDAGLNLMGTISHEYEGPWAMPTLSGAGGQTIAGAFSTGTHGGDVELPPIADAVHAIHLVGPGYRKYWIERELGPGTWLVDAGKLRDLFGGEIEFIREPDALEAAMVAVGRPPPTRPPQACRRWSISTKVATPSGDSRLATPITKSLMSGTWASTLLAVTRSATMPSLRSVRASARPKNAIRMGMPFSIAALATDSQGSMPRHGIPACCAYWSK
jgi:hypothetical protein